jgi:phospholipid/cholesterol/gamma-HCH transport system substrate-binding protein
MSTPVRKEGAVGPARTSEVELEAAVPRRTSRREMWVGLFATLGLVAILTVLFMLTDPALFRGRYMVRTTVEDAGGLRRGDPVQMRGVNIGQVKDFRMVPGGVSIRLELEGEYKVPEDSRVVLRSNGLLGGRVAEIMPGSSPTMVGGGGTLAGQSQEDLDRATASLTEGAQTALGQVNALLSAPTVNAVQGSAVQLQLTLRNLAQLITEQRGQLAALTSSLRQSAAAVADATSQGRLTTMVARLDTTMVRLDAAAASISRASTSLDTVMGRMARGDGTLGRLSKDDALYDNLNAAAVSLRNLLDDVRAHPKRYLGIKVF